MTVVAERRAEAVRHRRWLPAALTYGALLVGCGAVAFWLMFTRFGTWDDEGTVLSPIALFVGGQPLYRVVDTIYGPFYYEVFGGLFSLTGTPVTMDAGRLIVAVLWAVASVMFGGVLHRITGRLALGAVGTALTFGLLGALVYEPTHPISLVALLLSVVVLTTTTGLAGNPSRRTVLVAGAIGGAAISALLFTKINIGVFAIAAFGLSAVFTLPALAKRRWLSGLTAGVFVLMPLVLTRTDLGDAGTLEFALVTALGLATVAGAGWNLRGRPDEHDAMLTRRLATMLVAFGAASAVILGVMAVVGSSPADVFHGIVELADRARGVIAHIFVPPTLAFEVALGLVGVPFLVLLRIHTPGAVAWRAGMRISIGLVIWLTIAWSSPLNVLAHYYGVILPLFLAWVALVPPAAAREAPTARFVRLALVAFAVLDDLQIYPANGDQIRVVALLYLPVGALCVADGLRELDGWRAAHPLRRPWLATATTVACVALAVAFVWSSILRPGVAAHERYTSQQALTFPGSTMVRLPTAQAATYERLVRRLRSMCDALVGYPSVPILYFWASIPSPTGGLGDGWMYIIPDDRQRQIVDEARRARRPCALRNDRLARFWLRDRPRPRSPLVQYVFDDFVPVERIGDFELMVPRNRARVGTTR